jgi:predicted regulator of Ras-like GTPase activity (Roadblock/LC7/MglB family)
VPGTADSIRHLLDHLVRGVPGVTGAIVATADGFVVAHHLPMPPPGATTNRADPAGLAAMTAAVLGLGDRLAAAVGAAPSDGIVVRSSDGHVVVHRVAAVGGLAVLTGRDADLDRVQRVAGEIVDGVRRVLSAPTSPVAPLVGTSRPA